MKRNQIKHYDPSPSSVGMLYIYNIYFFKDYSNRKYSERDVKSLKETFRAMNWDVLDLSEDTISDIRKNERTPKLGKSELERIKHKMNKISRVHFPEACKTVAIAVLTHGSNDGVIQLYSEECKLEETFLEPLFANDTLQNKLRWLIYPGCRGSLIYEPFSGSHEMLNYRYYMVTYATEEGYMTRREKEKGNVFIQEMCRALQKQAAKDDILTILEEVKKIMEHKEYIQKPENDTNLSVNSKWHIS